MSATIKQKFADARIAITNTLASEDIQKRMNSFGFNQRRMQDGNGLLDQVTQLTGRQVRSLLRQYRCVLSGTGADQRTPPPPPEGRTHRLRG